MIKEPLVFLKLVYIANIMVAGCIGITSLFFPRAAAASVFSNAYPSTEVIRLTGCLWLAIALLSAAGLFRPMTFSPVLLLQLIYKAAWLLVVALPALSQNDPYPKAMTVFFITWVIILPFIIPWKYLF